MDYLPGQQVGVLQIEGVLGEGSFGTVYLARDTLIGRQVALKSISAGEDGFSDELREEILSEARLIGNLNSPQVVTLFRLHETGDGGFLQEMEYVDGGSLADLLEPGKKMDEPLALEIFGDICRGLRAAHASRVVHGDVKPANVLLAEGRRAKLSDFGVARALTGERRFELLHGKAVGSPIYMAPEIISGYATGLSADIWAACVVLYRLLSGRFPFEADSFDELSQVILTTEPAPFRGELHEGLETLILRGLVKNPEQRAASIDVVLDELNRYLSEFGAAPELARDVQTNCTRPPTSFVGRDREIDEVAELLRAEEVRHVTMTGPGGIGKTRLSREICLKSLEFFPGGCWFIDLAEVTTRDGIASAVAEALRVELPAGDDPVKAVGSILKFRPDLLLVLDNFEQLVPLAGETVGPWRAIAPQARFLVTSRVPLGLDGEVKFALDPLPTEPAGEAVQLFIDRAREVNPEFTVDAGTREDISRIVAELDGMPLAIELAAARSRIMRPDQIAKNLGRKFQLLKSTRRDVVARQRTLTAAIEWSYDLLEEWEKEAFLQACRFRDGFTLEAADRVVDLTGFPDAPNALGMAKSLREKSLLNAYDSLGQARLGMYRAVREYGEGRWLRRSDVGRREALDRRFQDYFLEFAEHWNELIPGYRDQEAMDRISAELANLTAVHERAVLAGADGPAMRAALAVAETMTVRRPPSQLVELLDRTLEQVPADPSEARVRLAIHHGVACRMAGDWDRAAASADWAVAGARTGLSEATLSAALVEHAEIRRNRGELDAALPEFIEAEELATRAQDWRVLALSIGGRGMVLGQQRDLDAAYRCFCEAESTARGMGDHQTLALHLHNRGVVYESRAELDAAIACYREAEDVARRIGSRVRVAVSLGGRANALAQRGNIDDALVCYREAEEIARELGARQRVAQIVGNRGGTLAMVERLDEALVCYEEAETIARDLGDLARVATTLGQRARLLAKLDDAETALRCFVEAEELSGRTGDRFSAARLRCDRGTILYRKLGRLDEAREALTAGLRLYDEMNANQSLWYFAFKTTLAEIAGKRGDEEESGRLALQALALAKDLGITCDHADASIRENIGVLLELTGRESIES